MSHVHRSEFWPVPSAHRVYWETHHNPDVFTYDSADDGPEVDVIRWELFMLLADSVFK